MKFDDLDLKMRIYETAPDRCVVPNMYMVARLDGRNFTRLTKETYAFEAPFDDKFRDLMIDTLKHLMNCGFKVIYGYTESDEISLLFDLNENAFGRKHRKYTSILAGEASAKFSSLLGGMGVFDCRIAELPNAELVMDYFRWRNEDAYRNALNAHCYWRLRQEQLNSTQATRRLEKLSVAQKNELLFQYGINFNDLPNWQKRGIGAYWKRYSKEGQNPVLGQSARVERSALYIDLDLPMRENYSQMVNDFLVTQ